MTITSVKGVSLCGIDGNGRLTLNFVRRKAAGVPGISYVLRFSDTPASTDFAANTRSITGGPVFIDAMWERVK